MRKQQKDNQLEKLEALTKRATAHSLANQYIFNSSEMRKALQLGIRVANSQANVLITGESGTGKDVIVRIIHNCSTRSSQKLVKVSLSCLPQTLIEAELFGIMKGSFTGALANRKGKFEEADKGTLFLDEIGELPTEIQLKLLQVIQDREVTRLGSNISTKLDFRLITATNKDLSELLKENKFRKDLFYRLNVININLAPLRRRKEEIPQFVDLFIKKFCFREKKNLKKVSDEFLKPLTEYKFPGNVRELENIIERAVVLSENKLLIADDLPAEVLVSEETVNLPQVNGSELSLPEKMCKIEKSILLKALKKFNYHQTKAAIALGISEARLRYKIKILGIPRKKNSP